MTPDFRAEQQHAMHSLKGDPHRKLDWWRRVSRYTILGTVLLLVVSVLANITFYRKYERLSRQFRQLQIEYAKLEKSVRDGSALTDARLKKLEAEAANRGHDEAQ